MAIIKCVAGIGVIITRLSAPHIYWSWQGRDSRLELDWIKRRAAKVLHPKWKAQRLLTINKHEKKSIESALVIFLVENSDLLMYLS